MRQQLVGQGFGLLPQLIKNSNYSGPRGAFMNGSQETKSGFGRAIDDSQWKLFDGTWAE